MALLKVGRHQVELTHQDKILFPGDGITKGDLLAYYQEIASVMVPHMKNRAVTMHRFPHGIADEGFYQKEIGEYFPAWIKRVIVPKEGGHTTYMVCNDAASLVYLINQRCITPHLWLSRIDNINIPDRMVFDLDPGARSDFTVVRHTALLLRDFLEDLGLTSIVMTTGSRGLHVVVPLQRRWDFDEVRQMARDIAAVIVAREGGKKLTTEVHLDKRKGRLFIDTSRNAYAQTCVAPYAVRAKPGAPVATPVTWDEVASGKLTAQKYTIKNSMKRVNSQGDVWQDIAGMVCSLTMARKKLDLIMARDGKNHD